MTVIRKGDLAPVSDGAYPDPCDDTGPYQAWRLSDAGGLTQFGVLVETLPPGSYSSQRHWHENEDEFVYLLEGAATLLDDAGAQELRAGDAVAWKAGDANGHRLHNRSDTPVSYLIVGTRAATETCHYPDIDLVSIRDADGQRYEHKDGRRYPPRGDGA